MVSLYVIVECYLLYFTVHHFVRRENMKIADEMYGLAADSGTPFNYDKAPDRGWQEGRKDFSHKVNGCLNLFPIIPLARGRNSKHLHPLQ